MGQMVTSKNVSREAFAEIFLDIFYIDQGPLC